MKGGGGGGKGGAESSSGGGGVGRGGATSYEVGGGRQRFTVELRPGETTIVSWKKLLKDATNSAAAGAAGTSKPNGTGSAEFPDLNAPPAPVHVNSSSGLNPVTSHPPPHHPSLDSRIAPGQVLAGEKGGNDAAQPPSNRLNTVIERIERLYVGRASSDDEDANDVVPDDDEYDTEDSFIDDTELDEYFQVDNSAVKHDGFFVNRGKLERVEPSTLPNEQPKKRRRKDVDGGDDGRIPNKLVKAPKRAGKPVSLVEKNASALSTVIALPNIHSEDVKHHNQANSSAISSRKKYSDVKGGEQCLLGVVNGNEMAPGKDFGMQKHGTDVVNSHGTISDASNQRPQEKSLSSHSKNHSGKYLNNSTMDQSGLQKEKTGVRERSELSVADSKNSVENVRNHAVQKREGSSVRPKSTLLEKAIRDLEKLVAESRPPTGELQEGDNSSQAIKRRLPAEVKQKLAKVARFAQASHGKISKELINRLMSIVGHLIQLRTLKRNLKIMVNMGLSAKQEKDSRVQLVKKEVAEMVMTRIPLMKSKALEQQAGSSDDFQEISAEEKDALKRKYSMDDLLEDKICDLYDLYVEGLEEDAGPQVRKLYAELSAMWPNGFMDNHGIKRAICRAKDRRRALNSRQKDSEKIKRKKMLAQKSETGQEEANPLGQPHPPQKLVSDSGDHILVNKSTSSKSFTAASVRMPVSFPNGSNVDHPKQERVKGSASNFSDIRSSETLQSKKKKRKSAESEGATHVRPEKISSVQGDGKVKTHKVQVADPLQKSNPQPINSSNFEQNIV
ncbi:OLC1v1016413C3 [Oldenlandia corymbosa var. corymbosa]|uniref:OLC1v1016413C3 n=1 Tax=Oldenlandia corymbosa var. corymbosa TaxID=529605 RepID=A0AAV1E5W9_OLDCO|nr:OLC1v1016413C3 [Oldenlandia corymbosa var. corymbosa]